VRGFVELKELSSNRLEISGLIENLSPGEHGFHVHEIGDCSAADASSAGGHFGHSHEKHGGLGHKDRHAGDLGNIVANSDGVAVFKIEAEKLCFRSTSCSVLGRSLVVHEDPDDLSSQPAGNSGARQACGVIPKSCCVN
jgi:Cu-Zn family superoxide dismutase